MAQIFSSFDQLKAMYDKELYSNVFVMASLMLTSCEQNFETLNSSSKYLTMVYYGHSAFKLAQYKKAETIYRQALHYKKTIIKIKNIKPSENPSKDLMPDIDVKFNLHICHLKLGHSELAIETIQSIPGRQRNAKINMTLAKLCQKYSMERTAISAYKEVLKECPLAIEAAEGLLSLGVSGAEVASLVIETNVSGFEWYAAWIKAKALFYARSYKEAITAFKTLDESGGLRGNHSLLVNIGEAYHYIGDNKNAISILQRARAGEPAMQRGLDILAFLLMHEKKNLMIWKELSVHGLDTLKIVLKYVLR
uniref:Anaphase-promoting complex subunit 7 n=1 Tax=Clastoptera arizonana TaxID=38151 RepID=A0A1B6BZR6_9HEMI